MCNTCVSSSVTSYVSACMCKLKLMLGFIPQSATYLLGYYATRSEQHGHHSSLNSHFG